MTVKSTRQSSAKSGMTGEQKKRIGVIIGSVLAVLLLAGLGFYIWSLREDPEVVRFQELSRQVFQPNDKLSDAERDRLRTEWREAQQNLSESQRRQAFEEMGRSMRRGFTETIDKYFDLPPEKRVAYLDEQIRQMEEMRKNWARSRQDRPGGGGPGGPPRGGSGPGGSGSGFGRGGPGGRDENGMSGRRRMLDATTPEQRAKFQQYFKAVNDRRKQLGLEEMGGPWGGRRGGGGAR